MKNIITKSQWREYQNWLSSLEGILYSVKFSGTAKNYKDEVVLFKMAEPTTFELTKFPWMEKITNEFL
jgi:hypothetical protein